MFIENTLILVPGGKIICGNCSLMTQEWFWIIGNWSGIIFRSKSKYFEHLSWYKIWKWQKFKSGVQISSSSNKSRPGTRFKMCSRSRQYQRFEYHHKLLSQKRSYGLSKSDFLIWSRIWVGAKSEPVCYLLTLYQFENILKIFKLVPPKPESPHVLRLGMYASGLQGGTKLRILSKCSIWEALWRSVPRELLIVLWILFSKSDLSGLSPRKLTPRRPNLNWWSSA